MLCERSLSAGELVDHFEHSKPTMLVYFVILREAGLIEASRHGKSIIYQLRMSVLEEALMGLAETVGLDIARGPDVAAAQDTAIKESE